MAPAKSGVVFSTNRKIKCVATYYYTYPTLPSLASAATTAAEASEGPKIQWRTMKRVPTIQSRTVKRVPISGDTFDFSVGRQSRENLLLVG